MSCVREYGEDVSAICISRTAIPWWRQQCRDQKLDYFQATAAGIFCELGRGSVDFPGLFAEMERLGYDGWAVVEQDVMTTDL